MFENVTVGDRIHLVQRSTGSEIKAVAEEVSKVGTWVDIARNCTLYSQDLETAGWELVGAESKADRIVKDVMKSLTRGPLSVRPGQEEEYKASRVEEAIRAALEAEND